MRAAQRHLQKLSFTRRAAALTKKWALCAAQRRLRKLSFTVRRAAALAKNELHAPRSGAYEKNELCVLRSGAHEHGSDRRATSAVRAPGRHRRQLQMQSVRFHNKGTAQMPLSALRTRAAGIRWLRARTAQDCTWCKTTQQKISNHQVTGAAAPPRSGPHVVRL